MVIVCQLLCNLADTFLDINVLEHFSIFIVTNDFLYWKLPSKWPNSRYHYTNYYF